MQLELTGTALLVILAEVAIGFAGFSAVVAALFRRRKREGSMPFDEVRFLAMLEFSLEVLIFSLLPLALSLLGIAEESVWRSVSALLAAVLLFHIVGEYFLSFRRKVVAVQSITWSVYIFATVGSGICVIFLILSAAGIQTAPMSGVYVSCLLWLLLLAAIHFTRLAWLVALSRD